LIDGLKIPLLIMTMAIAAIAGGCGDDDASGGYGGSSDSASDKAQFVKAANDVCARSKRQIQRDVQEFAASYAASHPDNPSPSAALPGGLRQIAIPAVQRQLNEIRELDVPVGEDDQVEAIAAAMQQGIDAAKRQPLRTSTQFVQGFKRFGELARRYGLKTCAFG
jgi:hypothetical protein